MKRWLVLHVFLFISFLILVFAFKGAYDCWAYYDYDTHLTQKQLLSIDNEDMTVVFYKKSCPYCKAGKQAVIEAGRSSDLPVFYVDVETAEGQELVSRYVIQKPATVLKIRSGLVKSYFYAKKVDGKIVVDKKAVKEAFNK